MTDHRTITRQALPRPSTANETSRTIELAITGERDPGDGIILSLRELPAYGPAPVPVLLSHANHTSAMAGRIESLRIEAGELIGLARFSDAPAAEEGWQLARSGSAVSVGASFNPADLQPAPGGHAELATRWRLREVSLVPVGADPMALTRSASSIPPASSDQMTTNQAQTMDNNEAQDSPVERAAERVELQIRRAAAEAKLDAPMVDRIVAEHRYSKNATDGLTAVVREFRQRIEAESPVYAGHPARVAAPGPNELQETFERALAGKPLAKPLVEVLRQHGYGGRSGGEIIRNAITGHGRSDNWLMRGFHSTSDAPALFIESGDRQLQARYAEPVRGIAQLARVRDLADFREVSTIDVGLVGASKKILEGGEIKFASMKESAGKYKPFRYGLGFSFTFEALANDDLAGVAAVLDEASSTGLEAEMNDLAELLTVGGDGAMAPDGLPLFHSSRNNSAPGDMDIAGLSAAVLSLRTQVSVGGRKLWLEPGYIMVGPERETEAAQLLSSLYTPEVAAEVNPWRNLQLIVEPSLEGGAYYLVAAGPRQPLELGRVTGFPMMRQEEVFDTSSTRIKIESAHGCAVADPRSIVRIEEPAA
jgi:hypothetical protein